MDRTLSLIFIWFIFGLYNLSRVYGNDEGDALNALKTQLTDPTNVLQSWDATLVNPCTWFHVTCNSENSVTRVDLGSANLSGSLVKELGQLKNLQYLELYSNNITGSVPNELGNLINLVSLDLYQNELTGEIPVTFGKLQKLRFLRLNNNSLTGTIPVSLTTLNKLQILDLSNNLLGGAVPISGSFLSFTNLSFANNPNLTYTPIAPQAPGPPNSDEFFAPQAPGPPNSGFFFPPPAPTLPSHQFSSVFNSVTGAIAEGVAAGVALAIATVLCRGRKRQNHFFNIPSEEDSVIHLGQLKRFSLHELLVATDKFSSKNILGRGGFGNVYKGRLADGSLVAIKRLKEERSQGSGELQFQTEVELISMAVHRNLLRLQGFCMTPTERLLVYPYMVNGSVASCLQDRPDTQVVVDWSTRERIALGAARGLAYLHDDCDPKIIHRDVKAANILLDEEFEAVVGDFGLAKLMVENDTHVTTAVRGTIGHIAPEYLSTGRCSEKNDVYGYGVVLLELVTGQRAYDLARLEQDEKLMLLDWVKELLEDKKIETLIDADLEGNYVMEGIVKLIKIALLCTQVTPLERPKMSEVVKLLQGDGLAERWEEWQKEEILRQDFSHTRIPKTYLNFNNQDSNYNPSVDQLSGPR